MAGGKGKIDVYNKSLTPEQRKASARKAAKASVEAKKAKKTMAERCAAMMNAQLTGKNKKIIAEMYGEVSEDATVAELVIAGQIQSAIKGNTKAFKAVSEYADKYNVEDKVEKYELPARVLGKAFVDINRNIVPNKTYVFEGGRGGLKSSFVPCKIIEIMKNNPMIYCCATRKVGSTLKDSVYAQFKWAINELGLTEEYEYKVSPLEIICKKTNQKIYFATVGAKLRSAGPHAPCYPHFMKNAK